MDRGTGQFLQVVRVVALLASPEPGAGRALANLEVGGVSGDVPVGPPGWSARPALMKRDKRAYDPRAVSRPIPLYGMLIDNRGKSREKRRRSRLKNSRMAGLKRGNDTVAVRSFQPPKTDPVLPAGDASVHRRCPTPTTARLHELHLHLFKSATMPRAATPRDLLAHLTPRQTW